MIEPKRVTAHLSGKNTTGRSRPHRTSGRLARWKASLQGVPLRPQTPSCSSFGRAAHQPKSCRHSPDQQSLLVDLQSDPSETLTIFLILDNWRQFLSVLKTCIRRRATREEIRSDVITGGLASSSIG